MSTQKSYWAAKNEGERQSNLQLPLMNWKTQNKKVKKKKVLKFRVRV